MDDYKLSLVTKILELEYLVFGTKMSNCNVNTELDYLKLRLILLKIIVPQEKRIFITNEINKIMNVVKLFSNEWYNINIKPMIQGIVSQAYNQGYKFSFEQVEQYVFTWVYINSKQTASSSIS